MPAALKAELIAPTVTFTALAARSNDATPAFTGMASDTTPVTVEVFSGSRAEGVPVAVLEAEGTGARWITSSVSPPLKDGSYAAVATQTSAEETTGVSNVVTFTIDTQPPIVTLSAPPSPSPNTTPSFTGAASEASAVTVEVFAGQRAEGTILAQASADPTGGSWISAGALPALRDGTFTAIAVQDSEIGNQPGKSLPVTFVVDTQPPLVTLNVPPSPSGDTTPTFSGTASEAGPVTVEIYAGPAPEGNPVASATATATGIGSWTSGEASAALQSGTFTAVAGEQSAIGNGEGRSGTITFTVETSAPTVTLNALPSPSADRNPSFSGTASDHGPVIVNIYRGARAEGAVVASAEAQPSGGEWTSGRPNPELEWGQYTALATQNSSIAGNPPGTSAPTTFTVQPIPPVLATEPAAGVTRASAALYATVDGEGGEVKACYFQYGTGVSYGRSVECGFVTGLSAFPPADIAPVPVFARIYGLAPGSAYHFRIVAVGEGGTSVGADRTFTTLPPWLFEDESSGSGGGQQSGASASRLAALIAEQLSRYNRTPTIAGMLSRGYFKALFRVPEAGKLVIHWYRVVHGTGPHSGGAPAMLRVASGGLDYPRAGSAPVRIRVTSAGRRALGRKLRVRLVATCVFVPAHTQAVRISQPFDLHR